MNAEACDGVYDARTSLASYPGPLRRRKGLVHAVRACVIFSNKLTVNFPNAMWSISDKVSIYGCLLFYQVRSLASSDRPSRLLTPAGTSMNEQNKPTSHLRIRKSIRTVSQFPVFTWNFDACANSMYQALPFSSSSKGLGTSPWR